MSLNLDTMPLKLLPVSTEHEERNPQVIGLYEGGSKHFVVEMRALKMKKIEDERAVLITNNLKQLLSKIFVRESEKFIKHLESGCSSFTSFTEHWKGEKSR